MKYDKYLFYEHAVQAPEDQVAIFDKIYTQTRKKKALSLREDFCGTFLISCEWVKSDSKRTAVGLDLDPEPIAYGKKNSLLRLTAAEKKRVQILKQDVCQPTQKTFDFIGAGNFSFFIFKEREKLKEYFTAAYRSLAKDGVFAMEMAGGAGFIETLKERRTVKIPGKGKFKYIWHQKSFDPIQRHGMYAIHFKTSDGEMIKNAFVYDWRNWTIPELRDLLKEIGFKKTVVYWEGTLPDGSGDGIYEQAEEGDNSHSWIAFVVALK